MTEDLGAVQADLLAAVQSAGDLKALESARLAAIGKKRARRSAYAGFRGAAP